MNTLFVVVPVYNVEKYLERCVDSILRQDYKKIKIILVNDGSSDASGTICDRYKNEYENIDIIHKDNGGLSDARNRGIELALEAGQPNDWITFLDSDDFLRENYASYMIELCESDDAQIAQCDYEKGSGDAFTTEINGAETVKSTGQEALLGYNLKSQFCSKIYKLGFFDDVRFPKGVLNEDEFTIYRVVDKADRVVCTTAKLYYYYQHEMSIMSTIAKRLKDNPHRMDWFKAYNERIDYFKRQNKGAQVLKTHEKICTDIILRYCEQMYLKKADRDEDVVGGKYLNMYKESFKIMIKREGMPLKRKLMYIAFYIMPYSAVLMGRIFTLRK